MTIDYKRPMHGARTNVEVVSEAVENGETVAYYVRESESFQTTKVYSTYVTAIRN